MQNSQDFKFSNTVLFVPVFAVLSIWVVYWVELTQQVNLNKYGIYPQTLEGLRGIFFSPFIHGSLSHLYNNSIPLGILLAGVFYFYHKIAVRVVLYGIVLSGIITWAIGRPSFHIGASGLIYVLASFMFFKGILLKHFRLIALSLVVVFVYGSLLWYIFPVKEGISWEGHLAGFITGIVLAFTLKAGIRKPAPYDWERPDYKEDGDPFLQQFDADGNFVPLPPPELEEEQQETSTQNLTITYTYKKSSDTSQENDT